MAPSSMTVWVSVGFAALAGLAFPSSAAFALQWACLWLGFALFFQSARARFFSFIPMAAPEAASRLGFEDNELEVPMLAPWYLLPSVGLLWALIAPAAMLADEPPLMAFGVGVSLSLIGLARWSSQLHRESVQVGQLLVRAPAPGLVRLEGRITSPTSALRLHRWWFDSSEFHKGGSPSPTHENQGAGETPTSTTYGYRQELRRVFQMESGNGVFEIDAAAAIWAAPPQLLSSAPSVDFLAVKPSRPPAVLGYLQGARVWEQESLGAGSQVIVLGKQQGVGPRLGASARQPLLVFGTEGAERPDEVLTGALNRRLALIAGQLLLAVVALAVAFV